MKTKYIILIITIFTCFYKPIQAQDSSINIFDGIQSSINQFTDNFIEEHPKVKEFRRLIMLRKSDIRISMNAKYEAYGDGVGTLGAGIYYEESEYKGSLYVEFDWENKALMMRSKSSENTATLGVTIPSVIDVKESKTHEGQSITQYTDKDGYWYVPYLEKISENVSELKYVKFNARQVVDIGLDVMQLINTEDLVEEFKDFLNMLNYENLTSEELRLIIGVSSELENLLREVPKIDGDTLKKSVEKELKKLYSEVGGFPIFIHWALMYSPKVIKAKYSKYKIIETPQTCLDGSPEGCIKLTIGSGPDKGKFMIFDKYGRLIFIDAKKDGTALFEYGKDVTVTIPPARKLGDVMNLFGKN